MGIVLFLKLLEIHVNILFRDMQIITGEIKAGCIQFKVPDKKTTNHIAKKWKQEGSIKIYKDKRRWKIRLSVKTHWKKNTLVFKTQIVSKEQNLK